MTSEQIQELLGKLPPLPKPFWLSDAIVRETKSNHVNGNVLLAYLKLYGVDVKIMSAIWCEVGKAILQGNTLFVSSAMQSTIENTGEADIKALKVSLMPHVDLNSLA